MQEYEGMCSDMHSERIVPAQCMQSRNLLHPRDWLVNVQIQRETQTCSTAETYGVAGEVVADYNYSFD